MSICLDTVLVSRRHDKSLGVQCAILGVTSLLFQARRVRAYMYICMHLQATQVIVYGGFLGWFMLLI
jgi:hypothetical protein